MTSVPPVFALLSLVLIVAAVVDRRRNGSDSVRGRIWLRSGLVFGVAAVGLFLLELR